jgi:hypothetical protein
MDNNVAERLCKLSAIGRKNYLTEGNERGGQAAAIHDSMVSIAKASGVEPFGWLRACNEWLPYHRSGRSTTCVSARSVTNRSRKAEDALHRTLTIDPYT